MAVSAENLIAEVGISTSHRKSSTINQNNEKFPEGPSDIGPGLEGLIHRGARQVIRQAIDAEFAQSLEHYSNVKTLAGAPSCATAICPSARSRLPSGRRS